MVQNAPVADLAELKQHASTKFDTLERFMWPGGSEPKPTTNKNHVRMYGHNLCPFVARSRWTFACKEVPYQEVLIDLQDKGQWHLDFNKGFIPVLEVPSGELIPESGICSDYAMDVAGPNQGINLIPEDPLLAAKMRVKMVEFDSKILPFSFGMYLSRFADMEKIDDYVKNAIPFTEAMCPEIGSDKWLFGTDELTQLDIHCGAQWDFIYVHLFKAAAFGEAGARANLAVNSPKWVSYMERIRAHPKIAPTCMNLDVADRHAARTKTWAEGEKCQLSLDVMKGAFPDLP